MRSPNELARELHLHYAKDASGHEHKSAGPGGGQFTGQAEHGQAPDEMAAKLKAGSAKKPPSVDDMADFLVDHGVIGSEQSDDFSPEQITAMFAKANAAKGAAPAAKPAAQARSGERLGVLGKPAEPGGIPGRFDKNNLPKKGDTIAYYDGEGGIEAREMTGQVLDVQSGGGSRTIQVRSRTGNPIWIESDMGRPHEAKR